MALHITVGNTQGKLAFLNIAIAFDYARRERTLKEVQ